MSPIDPAATEALASRIAVMNDDLDPGVRVTSPGGGGAAAAPLGSSEALVQSAGLPAFDLDSVADSAGVNRAIDWNAPPGEGWGVRYSPYAPQPAMLSSSSFSQFLVKPVAGNDTGDIEYDSLGNTLLGKKSKSGR